MESMNPLPSRFNGQELFHTVREMIQFVEHGVEVKQATHVVEEGLLRRVLEMGRHAHPGRDSHCWPSPPQIRT